MNSFTEKGTWPTNKSRRLLNWPTSIKSGVPLAPTPTRSNVRDGQENIGQKRRCVAVVF